jgi:uncharacterized protein YecE (DUF72 family)
LPKNKLICAVEKSLWEAGALNEYLIGTGGWAYFKVPNKTSLKAYSEIFNFVEVNYTFYEYPDLRTVERWRRIVPKDFTFAVRCHQDLTHRIGLKPVDEAYAVLAKMKTYCEILEAPFLVLETPASYVINEEALKDTKTLFSSVNFKGVRLVWEIRASVTTQAVNLMQELNIVNAVDLSKQPPGYTSDTIYSRIFGKGQKNLYQFIDEELVDIDRKVLEGMANGTKKVALSYHGARMNTDAARFLMYKKTGKFMPVTSFTGTDSVRAVLSEDAQFPISKSTLVSTQGWKVVDLTQDKRAHLAEILSKLPDKNYNNVDEVTQTLETTE